MSNLGLILDTNRKYNKLFKNNIYTVDNVPALVYNIELLKAMQVYEIVIMVKTSAEKENNRVQLKPYFPNADKFIDYIVLEDLYSYKENAEIYKKGNSSFIFETFLFFKEVYIGEKRHCFDDLTVIPSNIITIGDTDHLARSIYQNPNDRFIAPLFNVMFISGDADRNNIDRDKGIVIFDRLIYNSIASLFTSQYFGNNHHSLAGYLFDYVEDTKEEFGLTAGTISSGLFTVFSTSDINNPFELMPCVEYLEAYKKLFKQYYLSYNPVVRQLQDLIEFSSLNITLSLLRQLGG